MIATLTGEVSEKIGSILVLDVQGVGYGLLVTSHDFGASTIGKKCKVYVYEHIREQSHDLFGFLDIASQQLFELLLSVNGVGPKMALAVLDLGAMGDVQSAIARGDTKFIQAASGVGKKVAERIVVDLKDKLGEGVDLATVGLIHPKGASDEAVAALESLGFSREDAAKALSGIDVNLSTEERIKQALKSGA